MRPLGLWLMLVGSLRLASVWFGFFDIWALRLAVFSQTQKRWGLGFVGDKGGKGRRRWQHGIVEGAEEAPMKDGGHGQRWRQWRMEWRVQESQMGGKLRAAKYESLDDGYGFMLGTDDLEKKDEEEKWMERKERRKEKRRMDKERKGERRGERREREWMEREEKENAGRKRRRNA
ncbi:hypothetical protein COCNU_06G019460 [Cocos nucifera]|uniref:Uncharacterized protein n=1 Tax=Cocos nucifera TaxID=13894 RepID=A0A8K0IDW3_COCNU|nr:hypothetical protein COCNU_06G019460 [Cocos nucifera]